MTRLVTLSLVAVPVLALAAPLSAETWIGLQGGVNVAGLRQTPADPGFSLGRLNGPAAGAAVDVGLGDRLSLSLEPMFLAKGGRFRIEADDFLFDETVTGRFRLSYVELPVLFRVSGRGKVQPYVMAGPTLGYLVRARIRGQSQSRPTEEKDAKEDFKKLDFGLDLGAGVRFPAGRASLFVEGHYVRGLWNVGQDTYDSKLRTTGIRAVAGLTFLSPGRRPAEPASTAAASPRRAQERHGLWLGFGMGHGSAAATCPHTNDCRKGNGQSGPLASRVGGATTYLKVGGTLGSRVLLGAELTAWSGLAVAIPSGRRDETLANLLASAYLYPVPSAGFFLKGGVGVSSYSRHESRGSSSRGLGLGAGIGYDVRVARNVSLTPALGFVRGFVRGTSTFGAREDLRHNVLDATLGVTIH
jgi:Outer membrane protein beta-barrel domain